MRRRLMGVFLAVTTMVALAFVVPLALLVRDVARSRAIDEASREAGALTPLLAVTDDLEIIEAVALRTLAGSEGRLTAYLPDGSVAGAARHGGWVLDRTSWPYRARSTSGADLPTSPRIAEARAEGRAFTGDVAGGVEVIAPVVRSDGGISVVQVFVPSADLERGVRGAWLSLGIVGLTLVVGSVLLADRLARSITRPVVALAAASRRLGEGDLTARVQPDGPPEIADVGEAFNVLAERVDELLRAEREDVADLAHRLRTPLAALRLQVDQVEDPVVREQLAESSDALATSLDQVIRQARRQGSGVQATADLAVVVNERAAFWEALADEQERDARLVAPPSGLLVRASTEDLAAMLDVLIENVYAHTTDSTAYGVVLLHAGASAVLSVEDAGDGFVNQGAVSRGRSRRSTGLGLDIARRTADSAGGDLTIGTSDLGGARVTITFPLATPGTPSPTPEVPPPSVTLHPIEVSRE